MAIGPLHLLRGLIKKEHIAKDEIQIEIPIVFFAGELSIAIDSTGVKYESGNYLISNELVKHLKKAYLEAAITDFSATDATVAVELYNVTDASVVTSVSLSSDNYRARSSDIGDTIKGLVGKEVRARVNVTTASGTSGATAKVRAIKLILVLGIS